MGNWSKPFLFQLRHHSYINSKISDSIALRLLTETHGQLGSSKSLVWIGSTFSNRQILYITAAQGWYILHFLTFSWNFKIFKMFPNDIQHWSTELSHRIIALGVSNCPNGYSFCETQHLFVVPVQIWCSTDFLIFPDCWRDWFETMVTYCIVFALKTGSIQWNHI